MQFFNKYLVPHSYRHFYKEYKNKSFILLDVGCGSNSASKAKYWFSDVIYHGIDREMYYGENTDSDIKLMDKFFIADLDETSLDFLHDNYYDVIIVSHVIEHLLRGEEIVELLQKKVKTGGVIYIEFPNYKSLSLHSRYSGTLNFCDDDTHRVIHDPIQISNILLKNNFKVKSSLRRSNIKVFLSPFLALFFYLTKKPVAPAFWDYYGFATYVFGIKRENI